MSKQRALEYFLGQKGLKKLNCAQSVVAAFGELCGLGEETVHHLATFGSGRAPFGECGALYALTYLFKERGADSLEKCRKNFADRAGSTKCRQIRTAGRLTCLGCVEEAAACVEKNLKDQFQEG